MISTSPSVPLPSRETVVLVHGLEVSRSMLWRLAAARLPNAQFGLSQYPRRDSLTEQRIELRAGKVGCPNVDWPLLSGDTQHGEYPRPCSSCKQRIFTAPPRRNAGTTSWRIAFCNPFGSLSGVALPAARSAFEHLS